MTATNTITLAVATIFGRTQARYDDTQSHDGDAFAIELERTLDAREETSVHGGVSKIRALRDLQHVCRPSRREPPQSFLVEGFCLQARMKGATAAECAAAMYGDVASNRAGRMLDEGIWRA